MNKRRAGFASSNQDEEERIPEKVKEFSLDVTNLYFPVSLAKGDRLMVDQERHPFPQAMGQTSAFFTDVTHLPSHRDDTRRLRILQYQNAKPLRLLSVPVDHLLTAQPSLSAPPAISSSSFFSSPQPSVTCPPPAEYKFEREDEPWRFVLGDYLPYLSQLAIFQDAHGWQLTPPSAPGRPARGGPAGHQPPAAPNFPSYVFGMVWLLKPVGLLKLLDDDKHRGVSQAKLTDMFSVLSLHPKKQKPKPEAPPSFEAVGGQDGFGGDKGGKRCKTGTTDDSAAEATGGGRRAVGGATAAACPDGTAGESGPAGLGLLAPFPSNWPVQEPPRAYGS